MIATEDALRQRIDRALRQTKFSKAEREIILPRLQKQLSFFLQENGNGGIFANSPLFNFEEKLQSLLTRFQANGLTYDDLKKASLKHPSVLTHALGKIERSVCDAVSTFEKDGLTVDAFLPPAMKQTSLLTLSRATIEYNIRTVVKTFAADGLTVEMYLHAALLQPSLFCQSPATIIGHIQKIFSLYDEGKIEITRGKNASLHGNGYRLLLNYLTNKPVLLTFANDNLELRGHYGDLLNVMRASGCETTARKLGIRKKRKKCLNVLSKSRLDVEKTVAQYYGHTDLDIPVQSSNDELYRLVAKGLFKNLKNLPAASSAEELLPQRHICPIPLVEKIAPA